MMKKRFLSWLLCAALVVGLIPSAAAGALAAELAETETLENRYISLSVSKANGGFTVRTAEGDRLKKSNNNRDLLYHDGRYDTSFISFRVGEGAQAGDYIFGGDYGSRSSDVQVNKSTSGDSISAVWKLDELTFTQTLSLAADESSESGMVVISLSVNNAGAETPVQARVLMDTCLGNQDYGYYQYTTGSTTTSGLETVSQERVITDVPTQLYASDDPYSPSVMAYVIHTGEKPDKAAFGHWSHLASTLFDFEPIDSLDFTNARNEYMTADSALAMYYDLGSIPQGGTATLSSNYGVFSNHATPAENSVAVNVTSPVRLELTADRTDFVRKSSVGRADFSVTVDFANIASENAQELSNIVLAVQSGGSLRSLNDDGTAVVGQDFETAEPFTIPYTDLKVGESRTKTLYFEAKPAADARYERITIGVYNMPASANGRVTQENKLGERVVYILLPGSDSDVPKVNFAAMSPKIIYTEGTRHLFVTVDSVNLLNVDASARKWTLKAYTEDGKNSVTIPHSDISFRDGVMDVAISGDMELAEGGWYLQLEWDDSVVGDGANAIVPAKWKNETGPELHFTVSADRKYKNDSYGIVAVVERDGSSAFKLYRIMSFRDEAEFEAFKADKDNYSEIVLTFRGEFTAVRKVGSDVTCYTAVSTKTLVDGESVVDNPIVVNDCLDFEDGTLSVYYENSENSNYAASAVCTEFDGKLYTNGARTSAWSGKAVFTKLEQNKTNYSLVPYDENGNRGSIKYDASGNAWSMGDEKGFTDKGIYLVWPNVGGIGQTISGLIFNLAYGQLGTMYDTDGYGKIDSEIGNVVSFSAAMDMTFLSGKVDQNAQTYTYWDKLRDIWKYHVVGDDTPYTCYADWERVVDSQNWLVADEEGAEANKKEVSASVMVRDVLFGCGEGFVGVNFEVGAAIKNYISGLPEIEGTIKVNTINNWSYGFDGKIDLATFTVEATVSIRSKNNVPVPDELYVFVSGFEPGINVDGLGVLWITGGGGGIKNLYDTVFATKAVPPLKLLLSVSFDIVKVLECEKATLSLGLTGVSVSAKDISIKAVPGFTAIDRMGLSLEWYPGIDLRANIVVNILQRTIYGGGYIVLLSSDYKNCFFEMFARARLNIPESVPIVGGMTLAGVDLGISSERIWGALEVLFITLGVTYYWGEGDVDFSSGSKAEPTFPELLGYDDVPVGYDAENDRTLYARVGTNTQLMASSVEGGDTLSLMNASAVLKCLDGNGKNSYMFDLGARGSGDNAIVQITFAAADRAEAESLAAGIKVGSTAGENNYGLVAYNGENIAEANANLSYNEETGKATYAFTATKNTQYGRSWYLSLPDGSDVMLYDVAAIPEVSKVEGTLDGRGSIALSWEGENLSELDQISFYLCDSNDPESTEPGHRIGVVTDSAVLSGGRVTLAVPDDVPSGSFHIRAVYSKTDEVNGVVFSAGRLDWVNDKAPGAASITAAKAAGDLRYELALAPDAKTTGYLVTVYEADGTTATDFEQVSFEKAESGSTVLHVGGSYETTDADGNAISFGLESGKSYVIGVTPYNAVTSAAGESAVRGSEVRTEAIYLPKPVTPTVTFTANHYVQKRTETLRDGAGTTVDSTDKNVYTVSDLTFTAAFSEAVSGTWRLNDGSETAFSSTASLEIAPVSLPDGEHSITLEGEAADGDSFRVSYAFIVDTMAPQLMLFSPVNGSFFGRDGSVTFAGVTDPGAIISVMSDGDAVCTGKSIEELAGSGYDPVSGVFEFSLKLPDHNGASQRTVELYVSDDVGNTAHKSVTLSHGGLAELADIDIIVDGSKYSDGNIPVPAAGLANAQLELVGIMADGTAFRLTGYNVIWDILTVEGSASIEDGRLSAEALSQGMITGKLAVASGAYRTASVCFGAPAGHTVAVSATVGGSATGGGEYAPGAAVTLTAVPNEGYRFTGWAIAGVQVEDAASETVTFAMPQTGNVTAEARFEPIRKDGGVSGGSTSKGMYAGAGRIIRVKIPDGLSGSDYLPYYIDGGGEKLFVPISAEIDGYMVFIAPVSTVYYFMPNPVSFGDIGSHWARGNIGFCAEREIFNGVADGIFAPNGTMTRAMFAAVLYRMAASPAVSGKADFTDVSAGMWYTDAITWCERAGIISGYGDGRFGTNDNITREQLCTMILRYIRWAGYGLEETSERVSFADEADISAWAKEAVGWCQTRGIVDGRENNRFVPADSATRAENCAVLQRLITAILSNG